MSNMEILFGTAAASILIAALICAFGWYFISAAGYYRMFQKAGEKGWKAFIPYYNDYIRFKISWNDKAFWIYAGSLILFQGFSAPESLVLDLIAIVFGVVFIIYRIKLSARLAKAFGRKGGMAFLLFMFPFIGSMILGMGKAKYVGKSNKN